MLKFKALNESKKYLFGSFLLIKIIIKWVILKYATTQNHPQSPTTTHNYSQSTITPHNLPQPSTTIHTHPKIAQKRKDLSQTVMLL